MPSRARWYIGSARDVVAVELDAAAVGLDQPGDHVEDRGLAGAVRSEQADRFAAPDIEARALHHLAPGVALLQPHGRQDSRRAARTSAAASAVWRATGVRPCAACDRWHGHCRGRASVARALPIVRQRAVAPAWRAVARTGRAAASNHRPCGRRSRERSAPADRAASIKGPSTAYSDRLNWRARRSWDARRGPGRTPLRCAGSSCEPALRLAGLDPRNAGGQVDHQPLATHDVAALAHHHIAERASRYWRACRTCRCRRSRSDPSG